MSIIVTPPQKKNGFRLLDLFFHSKKKTLKSRLVDRPVVGTVYQEDTGDRTSNGIAR